MSSDLSTQEGLLNDIRKRKQIENLYKKKMAKVDKTVPDLQSIQSKYLVSNTDLPLLKKQEGETEEKGEKDTGEQGKKTKKKGEKKEKDEIQDKYKLKEKEDLEHIKIGDWERQLPKQKEPLRKIIMKMPFFMNNRKKFIQKLNELFADYRDRGEETGEISCDELKQGDNISLLQHQKVVRDYLNLYTPYRGILLYHSLGAGKSASSIAIAEGFKSEKRIFVINKITKSYCKVNQHQ
jgi:hypothetical protein